MNKFLKNTDIDILFFFYDIYILVIFRIIRAYLKNGERWVVENSEFVTNHWSRDSMAGI